MDYADTELGAGLWGTEHHVRRTITGIGFTRTIDKTSGNPALDMHQHVLLYINQGLEAHQRAFSPVIIIEDLYLQTFVHTLDRDYPNG